MCVYIHILKIYQSASTAFTISIDYAHPFNSFTSGFLSTRTRKCALKISSGAAIWIAACSSVGCQHNNARRDVSRAHCVPRVVHGSASESTPRDRLRWVCGKTATQTRYKHVWNDVLVERIRAIVVTCTARRAAASRILLCTAPPVPSSSLPLLAGIHVFPLSIMQNRCRPVARSCVFG